MFLVEDKNDINARRPMDLHYMKMLRTLLRLVCAWPQRLLGEEVMHLPLRNKWFLFVEGVGVCVGGLIYISTHFNKVSFLELGHTYLTVFISVVAAQRVTLAWNKTFKKVMKEFVLEMHLFHYKHKTDYNEHIYQYIHKLCTVFVTVVAAETFTGAFLFNLAPVIGNFTRGMFNKERPPDKLFEHSINFSLPYIDYYTSLIEYIAVATINCSFACDAATYFSVYDITIGVVVFHIWGHLKILDNNLRSIPSPLEMRDQKPGAFLQYGQELSYTKEENKKVAAMLKNIVDHHRLIMSFMTKSSDAFGLTLCLYYAFHQVSGCILLLECSELNANALARYGASTLTIFQLLIQVSVIIELLGSQSETLKDAVYSVPWEYMDTSNRRVVLFLLHNVQKPIRLKAMGIVSVGVQSMTTILKTTFSYFMLLRTFD